MGMLNFDSNELEFVKSEVEEENRVFFWFKPKGKELNDENKFIVILNYEVDSDEDIVWGDFHAICQGEETWYVEEVDEELLETIYDYTLEHAPEDID